MWFPGLESDPWNISISDTCPLCVAGAAGKVLEKLFGFVLNVLKRRANEGNGNPGALLKARLGFCVQRICGSVSERRSRREGGTRVVQVASLWAAPGTKPSSFCAKLTKIGSKNPI